MKRLHRPNRAAIRRRPRVAIKLALPCVVAFGIVAESLGTFDLAVFVTAATLLSLVVAGRLAITSRALTLARVELAGEHRRFETIFMDARLGMALVDETGHYVHVNPALCAMLGHSEPELKGRSFTDVTHSEDGAHDLDRLVALRSGPPNSVELEKRYIARDGGVIWAMVNIASVTDPQPGEGFVVQVQDITERKHAESELAAERQLLDAFLETTHDQVYFKDRLSRFIRVSNAEAAALGFTSPQDAVGKTDADVFSEAHAAKALADEQGVIRTGQPILDHEELESFPDGREAWVSTAKLALRDDRGQVIGTYGVSRDITHRKRAEDLLRETEERWRTLLANSQEIVLLIGDDGRIAFANPAVQRWLGFSPDELIGSSGLLSTDADDEAALADAFKRAAPGAPVSVNHRVRHKDGSWHHLESTVVCLRDDPVVAGLLITARDVTEWVALEKERKRLELERRVSQRLEAVGQLAAGIAHEINTPLQYVSDSVTFLKDAAENLVKLCAVYHYLLHTDEIITKPERRRQALAAEEDADLEYLDERIPSAFTRTVEGINRVTSIVQAMKRFSHPSSSQMTPADLNEAITTTLAVCRNEYKYVADVTLELGELPLVTCHVGEINQLLLNLIINASQAIEEQVAGTAARGTITIVTRVRDDRVEIEVSDDGPGIPPELQDRIYEPFFTTKEIGKGSGQGLALARATIEQHSGSIECISAPGEGTRFTVQLPLWPKHAELAPAA
jgi:two-component system, NtrC family, sensor kinase